MGQECGHCLAGFSTSGSHQAQIQVSFGLWSHQRLCWGSSITFKLLHVVGTIYFLEVAGLTALFSCCLLWAALSSWKPTVVLGHMVLFMGPLTTWQLTSSKPWMESLSEFSSSFKGFHLTKSGLPRMIDPWVSFGAAAWLTSDSEVNTKATVIVLTPENSGFICCCVMAWNILTNTTAVYGTLQ